MNVDRREHRPMLAVLLKLSLALFSLMNVGVKSLGNGFPVSETVAARGAIGAVAIVFIAWRTRTLHLLRTARPLSHFLRSSAGVLAMFAWFLALTHAPMADATAVVYSGPIFATLLAAPMLRERILAHRWAAIALGFTGVLVMTGSHIIHADTELLGLMFALSCALFSAFGMIYLRQMSGTELAMTIHAGRPGVGDPPRHWAARHGGPVPDVRGVSLCRSLDCRTDRIYGHRLRHAARLSALWRGARIVNLGGRAAGRHLPLG